MDERKDSLKYCKRCGEYLGDYMTDDYYKLIRQKYCPACKARVKADQIAECKRKRRQRERAEKAETKTQLQLLKEENELLRQLIQRQRAELAEMERK